MDNWFDDVGKPTIFGALAAACGEVSAKLKDSLDSHEKASRAELGALRTRAELADHLQNENTLLRQQLSALKEQSSSQSIPLARAPLQVAQDGSLGPRTPSTRTPLAPRSTNQTLSISKSSAKPQPQKAIAVDVSNATLSELRVEYSKLYDQYGKLHEKYVKVEEARSQLETMYRDKLKAVSDWRAHARGLESQSQERLQKIKALRAKLGTPSGTPQPGHSRQSTHGPEVSTPSAPERFAVATLGTVGTANGIGSGDDTNSSNSESVEHPPPRMNEASRRLATNTDMPVKQEQEEIHLPPMPTSAGSVPTDTVQVKSEASSDPIVVSERVLRKRKVDDEDNTEAPLRARIKIEPDSDPISIGDGDSDKFAGHESMDLDMDGPRVQTPRKVRHHPIQTPMIQQDDGAPNDRALQECETDEPNNDDEQYINLHPIGSDKPYKYASPITAIGDRFRYRRNHSRPRGIASLAEDGELNDGDRRHDRSDPGERRGLLNDLLNSTTPNKESIILPGGAEASTIAMQTPGPPSTSKIYQFPIPEKRPLPFGASSTPRTGPSRPATAVDTNAGSAQSPMVAKSIKNNTKKTSAPRGDRLRNRPLSELKLSDFRVNPAANEGIEFAFTDIVRSREERSRLPGDLSVHADEFRAQARAQRHQTSNLAFTALLENWLGDEAWKLATMPTSEKEKHWEDAKMAELAKQCGRVKHRYQRQRTPPGAWRTDFPSTQEEEVYKAEAHKQDRETVSARYREAMRPGGLYIFRDE